MNGDWAGRFRDVPGAVTGKTGDPQPERRK
jgi:hypothetical protein